MKPSCPLHLLPWAWPAGTTLASLPRVNSICPLLSPDTVHSTSPRKMPYQRPRTSFLLRAAGQEVSLRAWFCSEGPETPSTLWVCERVLAPALSSPSPSPPSASGQRWGHSVPPTGSSTMWWDFRWLMCCRYNPLRCRGSREGAGRGAASPETPSQKPPLLRGVLCILCSCVYGSKMYNIRLLFVADNDFIFIMCTPCSLPPLHAWEGSLAVAV